MKLNNIIRGQGWTVRDVCKEAGISPMTYYHKLKNNSFKVTDIEKIAKVIGVDASEIVNKITEIK